MSRFHCIYLTLYCVQKCTLVVYLSRTQAETIRPGKTNCTREGNNTVTQCSQATPAVTNYQEPSFSASTKLKTPLEDPAANCSQKTLENMVHSSQSSTENGNVQLERRRDNSQSMEETDNHNSFDLGNNGMQPTTRASKPVAAVTGTSRGSPGKSTNKVDSSIDGSPLSASVVAVTDFASQTPPLSASGSQAGLPTAAESTVDPPSYPKRKLSRKQSNKALRHQSTESNTAKKSDSDKKAEAKSTQEKSRPEKDLVVEKEDTHEQVVVVVKEKPRDKVKPFTKDAGTGQAIPVEDAPHEGGVDAEDDLDDVAKKDLSARAKDKKKRSRIPPKKEEKEKRKKDRELEIGEFIKNKRLSSESIEVESTTSTENLDDENQSGDSDEKLVKPAGNSTNDIKEEAKSSRPNDSPTGQSAPIEEETSKEQPSTEPQANENHTKRNEKKTLQLTEILSDPFSRKPDKTSYNSKKIINTSKKPSAERTKSASSEEPDDSKPPTPMGGAKIRLKSKQSADGDTSAKADEQEAKSPESKVGDGVRLTTPHEIAASLLNKNTAITTRSKTKVEREVKESTSKCEVHPNTQSPPLGKTHEMLPMEGYHYMPGNMPHHPHPRYLDMRADFNRQDQSAALSLHAEPFVPTMVTKDQFYDDFRQMNRMEVSRLQTGKTLGDYMPPSVTQSSRHHYAKKHQENMFSDNKPMFEDPRALRHVSMMHPVQQQKVSPTMADESPMYPGSYHSERMGPDHHFNYHYNQEHRPEAYFEEDYSGLQSFDQQLVSRNARPNNLQYNLPEDGVSFHSSGMSGSHNIISASGRKGMNMMQGGGLTLTSPTSMFESPKKQQPPSLPNYARPPPGHPMSGGDESFHPRLSRQHYLQQLHSHQQMKASKQLHRMPPPGLGEPHMGEMMHDRGGGMHDRGGGMHWGAGDELGSDPMSLQMQQQHQLQEQQRRRQFLLQQQHRQHFDMDDYSEVLPSLHTSAASPVFSPPSLNRAPGSGFGFSSSMYEPKSSSLDLGWDTSKNHDNVSY